MAAAARAQQRQRAAAVRRGAAVPEAAAPTFPLPRSSAKQQQMVLQSQWQQLAPYYRLPRPLHHTLRPFLSARARALPPLPPLPRYCASWPRSGRRRTLPVGQCACTPTFAPLLCAPLAWQGGGVESCSSSWRGWWRRSGLLRLLLRGWGGRLRVRALRCAWHWVGWGGTARSAVGCARGGVPLRRCYLRRRRAARQGRCERLQLLVAAQPPQPCCPLNHCASAQWHLRSVAVE